MNQQTFGQVDHYIASLLAAETGGMAGARTRLLEAGMPDMSISPNQGKLLQLLARLCNAGRMLELGTLGAYSTLWLAEALPAGGKIITIEADAGYAAVARRSIEAAGAADRIELREGKAMDVLQDLLTEDLPPFDFVFIDADKPPYTEYFQLALRLCRPGAVIVADNVIRNGQVLEEQHPDERVQGVRRFNEFLAHCREVDATILQTVGVKEYDGMAVAVVKWLSGSGR